jgi:hypothetical protein
MSRWNFARVELHPLRCLYWMVFPYFRVPHQSVAWGCKSKKSVVWCVELYFASFTHFCGANFCTSELVNCKHPSGAKIIEEFLLSCLYRRHNSTGLSRASKLVNRALDLCDHQNNDDWKYLTRQTFTF